MNQISSLTDRPNNFIEFENDMKSLECQNIYLYQYNDTKANYIKEIESIFTNDDSLYCILKNGVHFPFVFTQGFILSIEDKVPSSNVIVEY